jgi:zinc protease
MIHRIVVVVSLLCALATAAIAQNIKLDYQERTLANGLRVVTLEDFSTPVVAVQLWYRVGSKDEDPKRQGFAHMFEHMMFRGTDLVGPKVYDQLVKGIGGNINAFTSFDNTTYVTKVPSNQLEMVLWYEAERMAFLKVDEDGFFTERSVVEEERRLGLNQPYGSVFEKVLPAIFKKHPYRWTPIGQIPHLRAADVDELMRFWETYYIPNNCVLVIVGAVKHDDAQALAKKYFEWIPKGPDAPRVTELEPKQTEPREITISEPKGPLTIVGKAYRTIPMMHADYPALQVLSQIMGGGESSRIYLDVVKSQDLAVAAGAAAFSLEQDGVLGVYGVVKPFGSKDKVMSALNTQIENAMSADVTQEELDRAKTVLLKGVVTALQTVESKANLLGEYALFYPELSRVNQRYDDLKNVTVADVWRVASEYLQETRRTTVTIEPSVGEMLRGFIKGNEDEGAAPTTKPDGNRVAERKGPKSTAVRPESFPKSAPLQKLDATFPQVKTQEKTLPNGLRVVAIPSTEIPLVTYTLGIKQGAFADVKPGSASLAAGMITQGTKNYSAEQLSVELDTHAIDLAASIGMDVGAVNANALTSEADRAMRLLAEVTLRPTFPEKDFKQLKDQVRSGLAVSAETPSYLADREFRKRLWGEGHPYARSAEGETKDVDALTREDLAGWWTQNVRPDTAILYVAGDLEPSKAFELAEKYFGEWKPGTTSAEHVAPAGPAKIDTHIYIVDKPGVVQSEIRIGHIGIDRKHSDYAAARVLNQIFGSGGFDTRLMNAIRVKKGLTYGISGVFSPSRFGGVYQIRTFSKTPATAEAVKAILEEVELLQTGEITEDELNRSRDFILGSFAGDRETPEATINDLWLIEYSGLPADYLQKQLAQIGKTTVADVQRVARTQMDRSKFVIVICGDAKRIQSELEKIAPVTVIEPQKPAGVK